MKSVRTFIGCLVCFLIASSLSTSCKKSISSDHPHLSLSHAVVNVTNKGSVTKFKVQSNVAWKLEIDPVESNWFTVDQPAGEKDQQVTITAVMDCLPNGVVRKATLFAKALEHPSIPVVKLLVLQQDSTYKK
jgi:hypothetical protein